jgi:hypothetical protein
MKKSVDLNSLIEEMDMQLEDYTILVNKKTGEIVSVNSYNLRDVEDGEIEPPYSGYQDWEKEELKICEEIIVNYDDYVDIPSKYDINEYEIMEDFCYSIEDDKLRNKMCQVINGRGAFRRFKDNIRYYGIEEDWYKFKEEGLKEIAIKWCKDNDIEYEDNK